MPSYAHSIPSGIISSDFRSARLYIFLNLDVCNIIIERYATQNMLSLH
jgi:hypothetical protein